MIYKIVGNPSPPRRRHYGEAWEAEPVLLSGVLWELTEQSGNHGEPPARAYNRARDLHMWRVIFVTPHMCVGTTPNYR